MIRTNKKTRIKGLPPKIQLQLRDAVTGSFPAVSRLSSDNRTGIYRTYWDDNNAIKFGAHDDIRNSIINYYRFNSGSSYGEIFPLGTSAGTSSFTIKPVWSTNSTKTDFQNDNNITLRFQMHSTGTFSGFVSSSIPFSGTTDDINTSSMKLSGSEYSFATGSLSVFNPGKDTAVSGSVEKSFSVAFWTKITGGAPTTPEAIVSIGSIAANWIGYLFSATSASLVIASNKVGNLQFLISDSSNNALVLSTSNAVLTPNSWKHVVCTYNGQGKKSDLQLYVDGQFVTTGNASQGTPANYSGMQTNTATNILSIGSLGKRTANNFNGEIDELIFFNQALDSGTINGLYRATAGIHHPNIGNPFLNGIYLGAGISTKSSYYTNSNIADLITDFSTSLYQSSGSQIVKGIGDSLAHFTPGQSLTPFKDNDIPAAVGKSQNNPFYSTGSLIKDVGEGFDEPLWSKSKIEIDLSATTAMSLSNFCGSPISPPNNSNKALAYYNFANKTWEPLSGNQGPQNKGAAGALGYDVKDSDLLAFTPSFMTYENGIEPSGKGVPTTSFGFPFHTKYSASSSQVLHMSGLISAPFVVEKIVLDFSASFQFSFNDAFRADKIFDINSDPIAYSSSYAVSNFFMLNQRLYNLPLTKIFAGGLDNTNPYYLSAQIPSSGSSTIRDLIGWGSIASFNNAFGWATSASNDSNGLYGGRWKRDLNIVDSIGTNATSSLWTGRYMLSFSAGTANAFGNQAYTFTDTITNDPQGLALLLYDTSFGEKISLIQNGGSNGLGVSRPSGRTLNSPISSFDASTSNSVGTISIPAATYENYKKINPYILLPTDKIVFGWVAPTMDDYLFIGNVDAATALTASQLTIASGPSKVILYGTYIKEGKEHNDTLNQLLTSNVVHEVIGG